MALVTTQGFDFGRGLLGETREATNLLSQAQNVRQQEMILQQQQQQAAREAAVRQALSGATAPQEAVTPEMGLAGALEPQEEIAPQMSREEMIQTAMEIDPGEAQKQLKLMGLDDSSKRAEASRAAAQIQSLPFEQREQAIMERVNTLQSQGRDPSDTLQLLNMNEAQQNQALTGIQLLDLSTKERLGLQAKQAARLDKGALDVKSSDILPDGTTIQVMKDGSTRVTDPAGNVLAGEARSKAIQAAQEFGVDIQQRRSQARGVGAMTSKKADQLYTSVEKMQGNNDNLRQLVAEVKSGGKSGPLINRLPTLTAATQRLENVKNRLGLDVVGSVTFGALSEGELKLAKQTAVPDLPEEELIKWAEDKINANEKLANYLSEQAAFLEQPGNTRSMWAEKVRQRKVEQDRRAAEQPPAQPAAQVIRFDAQGNII